MSREEILKAAISKAVKNGWDELELWGEIVDVWVDDTPSNRKRIWIEYEDGDGEMLMLFDMIFSHDFAKKFFGERQEEPWPPNYHTHSKRVTNIGWQKHLQKLVLEEDPIAYLAQFLDEEDQG